MIKKICVSFIAVLVAMPAFSAGHNDTLRGEVLTGLDIVAVRDNLHTMPADAPGELGADVYMTGPNAPVAETRIFVPTSMYMRAGAGLNLGFVTTAAKLNGHEYDSSGSWATQIGLGWNLSSYVRTEIDFTQTNFKFSDTDYTANSKMFGAMLYFDFARRYVMTGDVTMRRTFVPFMGVGVGLGHYEFEGTGGANGMAIAAPRAALGFNVMFTDLIGMDVMYTYQMVMDNGFGWNVGGDDVTSVSNIMASFRMNF